jgi:hypothetical protein
VIEKLQRTNTRSILHNGGELNIVQYVQYERTSCLNSNASLTLPSTAASLLLTSSSLDSGTSGVALPGNGSSDSDRDGVKSEC